jgi:hypothetical protein
MAPERCPTTTKADDLSDGNQRVMEREENTNLWADRLQEIPVPESGQAWMAMENLLNKELPPVNRIPRNYRVFGMVAPVLALIIGYVFVHGRHQTTGPAQGKQARLEQPALESSRAAKGQDAGPQDARWQDTERMNQPIHEGSVEPDRKRMRSSSGSIRPDDRRDRDGTQTSPRDGRPDDRGDQQHQREQQYQRERHEITGRQKNALSDKISSTAGQSRMPALPGPGSIMLLELAPLDAKGAGAIVDIPLARGHKAIAFSRVQKIKKELVWEERGWRLGVGFVQPVVTGDIQLTSNPYDGLNSAWKNYLPIVEVDYCFEKRYYLAVEAMFHQPQDAHDNLRFMYPVYDSALGYTNPYGPYSIVRLFYFKLPVTINYCLSPHWSTGLGLEYARYGSAIAVYNDTMKGRGLLLSQFPDVHIEQNELRGIAKVEYQLGRWGLGVRFDAGLTHFIDYHYSFPPFPNNIFPPVVSRNTTLEVTLHYFFWESGKPPPGRRSHAIPEASGRTTLWRGTGYTSSPK